MLVVVLIRARGTYNSDKELFLECFAAEASKRAALAIARFKSSTLASEFFLELG